MGQLGGGRISGFLLATGDETLFFTLRAAAALLAAGGAGGGLLAGLCLLLP